MKKLMFLAVFAMALGITSCGADDVVDLATDAVCESIEATLRADVDIEFAAYAAEQTSATCSNLKQAIDAYRASDCGADDAFAVQRDALAEDCLTVGN